MDPIEYLGGVWPVFAEYLNGFDVWMLFASASYTDEQILAQINQNEGTRYRFMACLGKYGYLNIAQWLHKNSLSVGSALIEAVKNGHVEMVSTLMVEYPNYDDIICSCAALNGHWDLIRMIHSNGFYKSLKDAIDCAARTGVTSIIEWGLHQDFRLPRRASIQSAARGGHLETVQFLHQAGCKLSDQVCHNAAASNNYELVQWLVNNNCPISTRACEKAAKNNNLPMLQLLRQHGHTMSAQVCAYAIEHDNYVMLYWATRMGCPRDSDSWVAAIRYKRFHYLKTLSASRVPWNAKVCEEAARQGLLPVLISLRKGGCPWDSNVLYVAAQCHHMDILEWARANGCPTNDFTENACRRFLEQNPCLPLGTVMPRANSEETIESSDELDNADEFVDDHNIEYIEDEDEEEAYED